MQIQSDKQYMRKCIDPVEHARTCLSRVKETEGWPHKYSLTMTKTKKSI